MNILHVTHRITRGGPSTTVPNLARAQTRLGHQVSIYSTDYHADEFQPPEGVGFKIFKSYSNLNFTPGMVFTSFSDFDIIHVHDYPVLMNVVSALKGVPFVLQAHGSLLPDYGNWKFRLLMNTMFKFPLLNRASLLLADADLEVSQYLESGVPPYKIRQVNLGVDMELYSHLPPRRKSPTKTILYLAKYHQIKGPDILVKAFSLLKHKDARLVMYGWDDGYKAEVERLVHELGLSDRIEVNGYISGKDKAQAFLNADVWVSPSRYEMFGMGLLEALACGTPIIVTNKFAIANNIPDYCGYVVPCDEWNIATAIQEALDRKLADINRERRIEWASQFDWNAIAIQLVRIYREVLTEKCLSRL